ncbi:probable long-chain-alcohol O-fatty-acyltransferase 5 [Euphorbia lathyris]|uniref:probable long-chain-alcohol O-fatty-acyltransferase 5 n=1 Tax=Euphorbia lathyris TaxID=212925 RepID=UPI0033137D76
MEEELNNFIKVWILVLTCLSYSYFIASKIPKGIPRLLSLLPIFYLFFRLPFSLSSFHFGGPTAFFLVWLSNSKLLLFSFDQGPLSSPPPSNLLHFISLASLPIKLDPNRSAFPKSNRSLILLPIKSLLLLLLFHSYDYKHLIHPNLILALYCLHLYLELEIVLAIAVIPARAIFGFELEPQFNEPYLSTSLQDFWGRRWNLMVTSILRPTVYYPVRRCVTHFTGPTKWASSLAILATFVVSGLMHELMYFYLTRVSPTWEVTWFFVLHGVCVVFEVAVKRVVKDKWRLKPAISGPLTVVFVGLTAVWLFFPQLIRNKMDEKAIREYTIFANFVKEKLVSCLFLFSSLVENKTLN